MMKLADLVSKLDITESFIGRMSMEDDVLSITEDSRRCVKGGMFIAVDGAVVNGNDYNAMAVRNGAGVIVTSMPLAECRRSLEAQAPELAGETTIVCVKDSRAAVSEIASEFYGNPSSKIKLVGVTGTNGKTSIATILYQLFTKLGYSCGLLSTIANWVGDRKYPTVNTTPGPVELNSLLNEMCLNGCEYCFMEVSSHALDQKRTYGLHFTGAIFTNLTHDHLDYHKTFANYLSCKKMLFDSLDSQAWALINDDDRNGRVMVQNCKARTMSYSLRGAADFQTRILEHTLDGMLLRINGKEFWCRLIGRHNASNLSAVYGAAMLLGAGEEETATAISTLQGAEGRLEFHRGGNNQTAVIDYAHTPDALENVLKALKELPYESDLVCVFGCGGDRDRTKRPEMAAIAEKYADRIFVTSDNPRTEDPMAIINDIMQGFSLNGKCKCTVLPSRAEAICAAIQFSNPGSMILIAGKGHEDYQIIGKEKTHFSDRETVLEAFDSPLNKKTTDIKEDFRK